MKTLSLLVIVPFVGVLAVSTANAETKCSTTGFNFSSVPCGKRYAVNYEACRKYVMDHGENSTAAWWYCTSQGYTK